MRSTTRTMLALAAPAVLALAMTAAPAGAAAPRVAKAPQPSYVPAFEYQFASNDGVIWNVSNTPHDWAEASQTLGAGGVTLKTQPAAPANNPYADSGVIVSLGAVKDLKFDAGNDLVPPAVVSSGDPVAINLYVDRNGDGKYLKFTEGGNLVPGSYDDDPKLDKVFFNIEGTKPTKAQVTAVQNATDGENTKVWAWVGLSGGTAHTATVKSVAGKDLVKLSAPLGPIVGYKGVCMDAWHSKTDNGTPVDAYACNGTDAQKWTVMPDYTLRVLGKCLNVSGYGKANGTKLILWTCGDHQNEKWVAGPAGQLINPYSGKCVNLPGYDTTSGTQLVIWDCLETPNENWQLPS